MDTISPDPAWGETLGLLATSYELQPDFVETDFLPTLLGLGAWDDRSWGGRIALERKLACMESASLLQEARCYSRRPRSLRVEHRLATGHGGQKLHAKVTLVVQEQAIRLLVGSANLTEPGHRRNREVVTPIVVTPENVAAGALVREALAEAPALLQAWWTPGAERVTALAKAKLDAWQAPRSFAGGHFAWSGTAVPLWRRFVEAWPRERAITRLSIVSPFWSDQHDETAPLSALLMALLGRDAMATAAEVALFTEMRRDTQGEPRPVLPASFGTMRFKEAPIRIVARAVDPCVSPEEVEMRPDVTTSRALHAKIVVAEGDGVALAYVGSANFTRRGWGFVADPRRANIEAGLLLAREGRAARELERLLPATVGEAVELGRGTTVSLMSPEALPAVSPWPSFVRDVRLARSAECPDRLVLIVDLDVERIEGVWMLRLGDPTPAEVVAGTPEFREARTEVTLSPETLRALLRAQELEVCWWESDTAVAVPLNVDLDARLELPLSPGEAPSEEHILAYYQGRITWEDLFPPPPDWLAGGEDAAWEPPPPSGVDTSRIQSYQVREFVESLAGVCEDLEKACVSEAAVRLALFGAVSPVALARQIYHGVREGRRSPTAGAFELVELLACLQKMRSSEASVAIAAAWEAEVDRAVAELAKLLDQLRGDHPAELGSGSAFARYQRAICGKLKTRKVR